MNKISAAICVITVLLLLACKSEVKPVLEKAVAKSPNVVFIAVDDLRPELGVYGNTMIQTPNMDKLAKAGAYFTNHYVQVPTCGASRYALMTGLRPQKRSHLSNAIFANEVAEQPENDTPESFIHQLKRKGYYTVGIGKISHSADGLVYGYEEQPSEKMELPYSWNEFHFNSGKWKTGWNAFFAYANGENRQSLKKQVKPYEVGEVDDMGYPDGLTAELAVSKLKELKDKNQPFFLGVGFFKPHLPFNAPKKYWDLYEENDIPIAPNASIPKNVNVESLHNSGEFNNGYQLTDEVATLDHKVSDAYARKLTHAYYAAVSYVDAQVGKVIAEIKALGLEDDTIIVLWGDHGWHLGNQLVWGKHTLFETALRSTMIVKVPGLKSEGKINSIVETVDIYPTILELCSVEVPAGLDGDSFVPILKGEKASGNSVAYSYFKNGISMRTNQYRITKYFRNEMPVVELYDHRVSANETINIAKENAFVVDSLLPILEKGNTGLYVKNRE